MKKVVHSAWVALATLLGTIVLVVGATMSAAVSLAAKAFVVPGTGTPNANVVGGYLEQALDRYIAPFNPSCTSQADCDVEGIDYFASFWPFTFISGWCVPGRCEKWNVSVEDGRANLHSALEPYLGTDEDVVIFGYSQGAAVTSNEMRYLSENYDADQFDNFSVVNIGSIDNRVGGAWTVLGFLDYIPILDVSTNLYNPISTGMPMTTINFQYDPVGSLPLYYNLLSVVNALIALDNVHGLYLAPNEGDPDGTLPYGYTDETLAHELNCAATNNCKKDEFGNVYITIPANGLPLTNAVRDFVDSIGLGWLIDPFIDLVEPALQVLVDTAYDPEADPGDVRYLSLLPFNPNTNLLEFGNDLFRSVIVGVEAFFDSIFDSSATESATEPESEPSAAAVKRDETEEPQNSGGQAVVADDPVSSTSESAAAESTPESSAVDEAAVDEAPAEAVATSEVNEEGAEESAGEPEAAELAGEPVEDANVDGDLVEEATDEVEQLLEDGLADQDEAEAEVEVEVSDTEESDEPSDSTDSGSNSSAGADGDADADAGADSDSDSGSDSETANSSAGQQAA